MIIDPSTITHDTVVSADVCIIGSGAGGGVCAKYLAEAGLRVIIMEEGGYFTSKDFTQREDDAYMTMYQERGALATSDLSFTILQGKTVGGSTTVNWMTCLRTPDFVLNDWHDRLGLEWMSPREMLPCFEEVERYLNILPEPYERHNFTNRLIIDGARKLSWHAIANGRNARGCVQCGSCGLGCPYDSKLSVNLTYIPDAVAAGAIIYQRCRAEIIRLNGGMKRVRGSLLDPKTGDARFSITVEAPVVIVAGSAINSPVLLLKSELANTSRQVGKNLTLHPTTAVFGLYEHNVDPWYGIPQSALCDEFLNKKGDGGGFWIEAVPLHPMLAATALPGYGIAHHSEMKNLKKTAPSIILVKEIDSSGSVTVSRSGRPEIKYRLTGRDVEALKEGLIAAARIHFAAGSSRVGTLHTIPIHSSHIDDFESRVSRGQYGPNQIGMFSAHPLGTCRMGNDSGTSVVKSTCETHAVPGLFVCDGSVLPTSIGVNPQVTIMALATRVSRDIAKNFSQLV